MSTETAGRSDLAINDPAALGWAARLIRRAHDRRALHQPPPDRACGPGVRPGEVPPQIEGDPHAREDDQRPAEVG